MSQDRKNQKSSDDRNKKRHHRRGRNNPNWKKGSQAKKSSGGNRNYRSGGGQKKRIRVRNLRSGGLIKRYGQLWEMHEQARKRYFEMYFRVDLNKRNNLEKRFVQAIANLRKFESALLDWQKVVLSNHFKYYSNDHEYSQNHQLDPNESTVDDSPTRGPHLLASQLERPLYTNDTEETEGTMEDLQTYMEAKKG